MSNLFYSLVSRLEKFFLLLTQPTRHPILLATLTDLTRSRSQLIAENALLRQQLITLRVERQVKKPRFTVQYFNRARPHQGIEQKIPEEGRSNKNTGKIIAFPLLNGLHHDYRRAAS